MSKFSAELWRYRELLYFLAWRDIKVRYKQAALGVAWAVIQPFFGMVIFTFFFGRIAGIKGGEVAYPLFSFSGLLIWTYFAGALAQAGNSLIANSTLITKVYFPRVLLPSASVLGGLLDVVVGLGFLLLMMVYYRVTPTWGWFLVPVFLMQVVVLVLGLSMFLSALNVRYRDIKYTIPFLTQVGMFISPVIYPVTFVPERYQALLALNPMVGILEGFRACLFADMHVEWRLIWISAAMTAAIFLFGALYFRSADREFADIV